jgi:hypothetical protein
MHVYLEMFHHNTMSMIDDNIQLFLFYYKPSYTGCIN